MHHDCVHAVGHGERLEVGLDGHGEGQFVNKVHRCAGDDGAAAQILEAEDCGGRGGDTFITPQYSSTHVFCMFINCTICIHQAPCTFLTVCTRNVVFVSCFY